MNDNIKPVDGAAAQVGTASKLSARADRGRLWARPLCRKRSPCAPGYGAARQIASGARMASICNTARSPASVLAEV